MNENKNLIFEIVILSLFLVFVIPVCVNASVKYNSYSNYLNAYDQVHIDIENEDLLNKAVIISNDNDDTVKVSLVFKIAKCTNSYTLVLGDNNYNLSELEYGEEDGYLYYNLGLFDVDKVVKLNFKLVLNNEVSYDDSVRYSFIAKGI